MLEAHKVQKCRGHSTLRVGAQRTPRTGERPYRVGYSVICLFCPKLAQNLALASFKSPVFREGTLVPSSVYTTVHSLLKRIFIRFEANKAGCIGLFFIEANQRILHAKRIKTEANIPC